MAINVSSTSNLPYDPITDFDPARAGLRQTPFVLVVNPALPVHSVADLVKLARRKPGRALLRVDRAGGAAPSVRRTASRA